jgi:predicted nucleotidyltransferase
VVGDDDGFAAFLAERVARIPGVVAVALGGSRAQGTSRPDSDWDIGLYYRRTLDPDHVRALGWPGVVSAPGEWGGGVMNGGAWLEVDGRRVDLIYRDLDDVEHWLAEAQQGRFAIQRLLFHLAGIPTYVVAGELATSQVLVGDLPRPRFPDALRAPAARRWRTEARMTLDYADQAHARHGDIAACAGLAAQAIVQAAHARLAADGRWALNEKRIVQRAGLTHVGALLADLGSSPAQLQHAVAQITTALEIPE